VAGSGAGAAGGQAADHRLPGRGRSCGWREWVDAFVQRLRELGWVEGRTVTIVYRWGEGRPERFAEVAAARSYGVAANSFSTACMTLALKLARQYSLTLLTFSSKLFVSMIVFSRFPLK
jgi:hypothetical protein